MYDSKRSQCEHELEELKRRMKHFEGIQHWYLREKREKEELQRKLKAQWLPFMGYIS